MSTGANILTSFPLATCGIAMWFLLLSCLSSSYSLDINLNACQMNYLEIFSIILQFIS
jgi:hypothetical protein